jgi:non-heme chloroperoxidase
MNRRDVFKSAMSVAGATAAGGVLTSAAAPQSRPPATVVEQGTHIATRDGVRLFFKDWGKGAPIVFLSAWALPSDMWNYQMVPLSEEFRCVAYDRRGHGRSTCPASGYDYDTLAADLAAVLDALDLKGVTLVGMSMAGGEMVRYLTRHGSNRIARIIFVATATPFLTRTADNPAGIPAEQFDALRRVYLHDFPRWVEENRPPFFVADTSREMQEWVRALTLGTPLKAVVECNRSFTSTDFRAELPKIHVPTLLIHGDKDVGAPLELTGRPTANLIRGSRLTVYEGAPHGLFVTHMERLVSDIRAFARS